MDGFANYGYDKLATKYKVKLVNLDTEGYEVLYEVNRRNDVQPHAVRVAKMLMDPANNYVISAAKLKNARPGGDHAVAEEYCGGRGDQRLGAGLNRQVLEAAGQDKPLMHGGGTYGINYNMLFRCRRKLHPDLAVIDGYEEYALGTGPVNGTPVKPEGLRMRARTGWRRIKGGRRVDGRRLL